jgi:aspartate dehydrogenase
MTQASRTPLRVAIAGLGAIGMEIARSLDRGIPGYVLAAGSASDRDKAAERLATLARPVPVVGLDELEPLADIVIECAPARLLPEIIGPFLRAGKSAVVLSCGALLGTRTWCRRRATAAGRSSCRRAPCSASMRWRRRRKARSHPFG